MSQEANKLTPLTEAEKNSVKARLGNTTPNLIDKDWLGLSEFGLYFGWEAVRDVFDDVITLEQADMFVRGARKIHSTHVYDSAVAMLAARSKPGGFDKLMKPYLDDMKAVE